MKIGICCGLDEAVAMQGAGFDYLELPAAALAANPTIYRGLPVEATNIFFPGSIRLFGEDKTPCEEHVRAVVEAAAEQGIQVMVVGSGGPRKAPDPESVDKCDAGFIDICAWISYMAAPYGIAIAPESLNREETNVGVDLRKLALGLQAAGVGYTADSYHVIREWRADFPAEEVPSLEYWQQQIPIIPTHVHFADLPRNVPSEDDEMVLGFFRRLRELGYDERISFEGARSGLEPEQILDRIKFLWSKSLTNT